MALPTTVGTVISTTGLRCHYLPPVKSSAGNFYVFTRHTSTTTDLRVYKASDPTSSWSLQTQLTTTEGFVSMWMAQDGDNIHIVTVAPAATTLSASRYHVYSLSSDSFTTSNEAVQAPTNQTANDSGGAISVSNGVAGLIVPTDRERIKGSDYDRVIAGHRTGGTWTSNFSAAIGAGEIGFYPSSSKESSVNGRWHVTYTRNTATSYHGWRTLRSDDSLSTEGTLNAVVGQTLKHLHRNAMRYLDGGTQRVHFPTGGNLSTDEIILIRLTEDGSGDLNTTSATTQVSATDAEPETWNETSSIGCALDGTTIHVVWVDNATQDLYRDSAASPHTSFGTDTEIRQGSFDGVHCNIYTRSGDTVLAFVYGDGANTLKYDEVTLAVGVTPVFATGLPVPVRAKGGVGFSTQFHREVERPIAKPYFDIPVRGKGGESFWTQFIPGPPDPIPVPYYDVAYRAKGGANFSTQFHEEPPTVVVPPPFAEVPKGYGGGESFVTEFHVEVERPIPKPHSDIPVRGRGGVDFPTQFHVEVERPIPKPHFDVPIQGKGGVDSFTQFHSGPPDPIPVPYFDIPLRGRGGEDFRTEFHEPPAAPAPPELFLPAPEMPPRQKGGMDSSTQFHVEVERPIAKPHFDIPVRGKGGIDSSTQFHVEVERPIAKPHFDTPVRRRGGVDFSTQFHIEVERPIARPHADIPIRGRGGIDSATQFHIEVERPIPKPYADTPVRGRGGVNEGTQFHSGPPDPIPVPHSEVPVTGKGGESFLTQFHEEPAAPAVEVFLPFAEAPKPHRRVLDSWTQFHEPPAPPPELAFAPPAMMPRRRIGTLDYLSVALGVPTPFARVRRGLYDDHGIYSRDT